MAGALLAIATLTHHMTSLALGLGLVPWFAHRLLLGDYPRRRLVDYSLIYAATTAVIITPWAISFLEETHQVGFRREVPGNWLPEISTYRSHILDLSLVGVFVYASYLDILLTLTWFSMISGPTPSSPITLSAAWTSADSSSIWRLLWPCWPPPRLKVFSPWPGTRGPNSCPR